MSKRIVDKEHLKYVSTLPCFISRSGFMSCKGAIQVHHLLTWKGFKMLQLINNCVQFSIDVGGLQNVANYY